MNWESGYKQDGGVLFIYHEDMATKSVYIYFDI